MDQDMAAKHNIAIDPGFLKNVRSMDIHYSSCHVMCFRCVQQYVGSGSSENSHSQMNCPEIRRLLHDLLG